MKRGGSRRILLTAGVCNEQPEDVQLLRRDCHERADERRAAVVLGQQQMRFASTGTSSGILCPCELWTEADEGADQHEKRRARRMAEKRASQEPVFLSHHGRRIAASEGGQNSLHINSALARTGLLRYRAALHQAWASFRRDQVRHTAVVEMLDNAFATKRFTRNAAQQASKTEIVSTFRFSEANTRCNAAKRVEKAIKQHVMPFLPPLTHATKFWRLTYCSIRVTACSCCRTASGPSPIPATCCTSP